jgi:UDP-N-acetylmuramoyl-L-alanyl-D-glutamate--2,6-diaminopimelate ligase
MKLEGILKSLNEAKIHPSFNGTSRQEIRGLVYDSRQVQPGDLFVAVRGHRVDGHRYLAEAVSRGAVAAVIEDVESAGSVSIPLILVPDSRQALALLANRFYGDPSRRLTMIGVTGTNGKTTTSYLIKEIFEAAGQRMGLLGTVVYDVGKESLVPPNTTPESLDLQRLLSRMVEAGLSGAVMEVSSHALAMDRVLGCEFDTAVFTNLTQDHLDFHRTMEDYFLTKRRLFTGLDQQAMKSARKSAVINLDDPWGEKLIQSIRTPIYTYGLTSQSKPDITAREVQSDWNGIRFTAITPVGDFPVKSALIGRYNLYNLLAAIGVGLSREIPVQAIQDGIAQLRRVPGRVEPIDAGQDFTVIVDFAHTEHALRSLLDAMAEFKTGRLITVFGCGGDRDRGKRPAMGRVAAMLSDLVILTSDNPRGEEPTEILKEIEGGIQAVRPGWKRNQNYYSIPDRREAIEKAVELAGAGDMLVIAGKGHETYQIIGKEQIPFDDRQVAREAIERRPAGSQGSLRKSTRGSKGK